MIVLIYVLDMACYEMHNMIYSLATAAASRMHLVIELPSALSQQYLIVFNQMSLRF